MVKTRITPEQFNFLKAYWPADSHFTSTAEIEQVSIALDLENYSDIDLRSLRNRIVEVYTTLMDNEIVFNTNGEYMGRTEKFFQYLAAMQSVTSVIDHVMYTR